MKKRLFVIGLISVLLFAGGIAYADSQPNGDPFKAIWDAISNLQNQVKNIQLIPGPQGPMGPRGPQGNPGPQGLQGIQGPAGNSFHLYDANNQDLGMILNSELYDGSITPHFTTYDSSNGVILEFQTNPKKQTVYMITQNNYPGVYFDGSNCTGNPYAWPTSENEPTTITQANGQFYKFTSDKGSVQKLLSYFDGFSCQTLSSNNQINFVYSLTPINLGFKQNLVWPLTVK